MKLKDYGYKVSDIAKVRHTALGKAVKGVGYNRVISALRDRKGRNNGYKFKRYRADLNWLKEKK